jgi:hypothetical protein
MHAKWCRFQWIEMAVSCVGSLLWTVPFCGNQRRCFFDHCSLSLDSTLNTMLKTNPKGRSTTLFKALLGALLVGGTTLTAGSAQAALFTITCNFTVVGDECLGDSGVGWFTSPGLEIPIDGKPQLGDKRLNIQSYNFNDFTNAGDFIKASGRFDFSWLDQGAVGVSTDDTWSLRAVFDDAITGDLTPPSLARGELNYTFAIIGSDYKFSSVEIDSAHIGFGSTVETFINGGSSPYLVSTNGGTQAKPLGGTFVAVKTSYSIPGAAGINSFSNDFTQTDHVPGPLPLVGIGAAFGLSRRIRSRIKDARLA